MPSEYRLEDDKFDCFMQAGWLKMEELGLDPTPENFIEVLRDYWYMLTGEPEQVEAYVNTMNQAKREAERAQLEAALAALDEE